jgi:RNA polymerase subunit RPABC4/transcription elongation factor Spt4
MQMYKARGPNPVEISLPGPLDNFRKSKTAPWFGIILASLVSLVLLLYGGTVLVCFLPIVIALLAYFVPVYFGVKNRKFLAVYGLVLFVVLGLVLAVVVDSTITGPQPTPLSSNDNPASLTDGSFSFVAGDTYHYTVHLHSGSNFNATPFIWVETFDYQSGAAGVRQNLSLVGSVAGGSVYATNVTFSTKSIYYYDFAAQTTSGSVIRTGAAFGPVQLSNDQVLSYMLENSIITVFLNIALLFYLLLILTWWMDSSKKKYAAQIDKAKGMQKDMAKPSGSKVEKLVCSECGTEVPPDAKVCPQCGEKFDDEDKKPEKLAPGELICSECGKTVKETDESCWNCGKKFEN